MLFSEIGRCNLCGKALKTGQKWSNRIHSCHRHGSREMGRQLRHKLEGECYRCGNATNYLAMCYQCSKFSYKSYKRRARVSYNPYGRRPSNNAVTFDGKRLLIVCLGTVRKDS